MTAGTVTGPTGRIQVTPGSRFYRGTSFMGFDLAAWLDEMPLEKCLARANLLGALATQFQGDWEGLPTLAEVLQIEAGRSGVAR